MTSRTCPKCKLINPADAESCDCGYQFATGQVVKRPEAPKYRAEPYQLHEVAASFRALVLLVGLQAVLSVGRTLARAGLREHPDDRALASVGITVVLLAVGVLAAVQAKRLAAALSLSSPVGYAVACLIPLVSIAALLSLSSAATRWCRDRGVSVGLLGPRV